MIESVEQALLAAWSSLTFIPAIGYALEAVFSRGHRDQPPRDEESLPAGLRYESLQ
jgi:hypothetical protein